MRVKNSDNYVLIDPTDCENFINYLDKKVKLSPRTINHYLQVYKFLDPAQVGNQKYVDDFINKKGNYSIVRGMLLNYLEFKGLSRSIFLPKAPRGRKAKRIIRDVSPEAIAKIKDYLERRFETKKQKFIFTLMYEGALRRAEVPTISASSFCLMDWVKDPSRPCELIVKGKGNKERKVLINPETVTEIMEGLVKSGLSEEQISNSRSPLFFKNKESDEPITEKMIYDIVKKASLKVIGRDIRPHEIRHCRATELEKMGVLPKDIKVYLGHSNLATTEIYLHTSEESSLETIKRAMNK